MSVLADSLASLGSIRLVFSSMDTSVKLLTDFLAMYALDGFCFLVYCVLFFGYMSFIQRKSRNNPVDTVQGISSLARAFWVRGVMDEGKDILAVQTLRNSTMAATFMASTAILLTVGIVTLSGQTDKLKLAWHVMDYLGERHENLLSIKLIIILFDLFAAFFLFASSIRLYNDVGYMINARYTEREQIKSPKVVAAQVVSAQLNRAGDHYRLGMRGFYSMVPLVFWIFSPLFLLIASVIVITILYHLDRTYAVEKNFHLERSRMYCSLDEKYCPTDENEGV